MALIHTFGVRERKLSLGPLVRRLGSCDARRAPASLPRVPKDRNVVGTDQGMLFLFKKMKARLRISFPHAR